MNLKQHDIRALVPLENETDRKYSHFQEFVKLGPERTFTAVGRVLGMSAGYVSQTARKFNWIERARAYDHEIAQVEANELRKVARKRGVDWAVRAQKLREAEWEMAEKLLEGGKELLERLLSKQERKLTGSDVARLIEVASKIGRLSAGMATDHQAVAGPDGGPVRVDFSAALARVYGEKENAVEGSKNCSTGISDDALDGKTASSDGKCPQVSPSATNSEQVIDVEDLGGAGGGGSEGVEGVKTEEIDPKTIGE